MALRCHFNSLLFLQLEVRESSSKDTDILEYKELVNILYIKADKEQT